MPCSRLARFHFLRLPFEIRQHIYTYVLPSNKPRGDISDGGWISGSVSILQANGQVYTEAIAVLFANLTFHIRVERDCVLFMKTYHFLDGRVLKVPLSVRYAFPEVLGRNLWRVQRVVIQIKMGIMNVGGFIVNAGTKPMTQDQLNAYQGQMEMLCVSLRKRVERIRLLHISVPRSTPPGYLYILAPVGGLLNVETVSWEGDVPEDIRGVMRKVVENSWEKGSFLRLPPEVREKVCEYLLPCHRTLLFPSQRALPSVENVLDLDQQPALRQDRGYTAILRTCRRVNNEARRILYANNTFRITVRDLMEPDRFDILRPDLIMIGASNFRLIRHFELATRVWRSDYDGWGDAFTRLIENNPQIESVICQESRISQHKRTIEVSKQSVLGRKGLRHIDFLPMGSNFTCLSR